MDIKGNNKSSLQSVTCINVQFCNVRPGKCVRPGNAGPERAHSWRLAGNKSPKCHLLSSWFEKKGYIFKGLHLARNETSDSKEIRKSKFQFPEENNFYIMNIVYPALPPDWEQKLVK